MLIVSSPHAHMFRQSYFGWIIRSVDAEEDTAVKLFCSITRANPVGGREQGGGKGVASR